MPLSKDLNMHERRSLAKASGLPNFSLVTCFEYCTSDRMHFLNSLGFPTFAAAYYSDCGGKYRLSGNRAVYDCAISLGKALRNTYRSEKDRKAEVCKIHPIDTEEFLLKRYIER